jgi:hypothetical protein
MKDGGSAFPVYESDTDINGSKYLYNVGGGMCLRDYFAGQALAGLTVNYIGKKTGDDDEINSISELVQITYNIADAMLAEREKGQ